jgi:dienelactone hydrolase
MTLPDSTQPRREFLQQTVTGTGAVLACLLSPNTGPNSIHGAQLTGSESTGVSPNMLGAYGLWAATIVGDEPPRLSYLQPRFQDVSAWRTEAKKRVLECLSPPSVRPLEDPRIEETSEFDGLTVERLSWQLPYGPRTSAVVLKPVGAKGRLPAIVALHDHGGNKFFGLEKISRSGGAQHPLMAKHQMSYYGGRAWANELARRGYVVLVHDAFAFASRKVRMQDVSPGARFGTAPILDDSDESITTYNRWAASHEHLMAKSLLSAGTTWPGVFFTEDQRALDYLSSRPDVDAERIGCAGLSGGGLRTVFLGGLDERIRCACCVGMMTTWRDYLLHKCYTHTWMIYVPLLPRDLDYPEILALRVPAATLVQNDIDDQLFTMPEMERADRQMKAIFDKAGVSDRYRCTFYPGPHKFDVPMQEEAFDWFDRWLKG